MEKIFKEIPRSSVEKIIISLSEWEGKQYLDIRIHYDASGGKGTNFIPTKRGVTIKVDQLSDFKEGVNKAVNGMLKELTEIDK